MPDIVSTLQTLGYWAMIGYFMGSIPFGILIARVFNLGDLREIGSGNIGATNVLRTGNKAAAAMTLFLDAAKGAAAVLIARALVAEDAAQAAGLGALLGHLFPIWLGFKGGKGVATFLGIFIALSWQLGLLLCGVWLLAAVTTRYSSIAALATAAMSPLFSTWFSGGHNLILSFVVMILIYVRHLPNIQRVKSNTEPKIGESQAETPAKT